MPVEPRETIATTTKNATGTSNEITRILTNTAADIAVYKTFIPPSAVELSLVQQLLRLCEEHAVPYTFSTIAALRFLRDKRKNVPLALEAMKKHAHWRLDNDVDNITAESVDSELRKKVLFQHGVDRSGRPVLYGIARYHDASHRDVETLKRMIIYNLETAMKLANPDEQRLTIVADLSQFSLRNMDYEITRAAVSILQANYPETMHVTLVCNAPFIFNACYSIIRPWLDPVTAAKVAFIRVNKLHEYVDLVEVPPDCLGVVREHHVRT